ncbi:hypothetical protein EW145_g2056 [Phellinidium pouzarii]|uniref:Sister chromatid cohesion protein DCC1 n=1 Tax=Phellinidium pouzarii TaxID=167371 RepID=A0A4S4LCK3_9AGAM|nr:hypothetical protein EW145_g2056 [Phellinidium pouzarii]
MAETARDIESDSVSGLHHVPPANPGLRLTIRGREDDEAVLCTADKTYSIRAVTVSNSFCILTPPGIRESGDAVIRDSVRQILELSPSIARLHRLNGLLRGCEYNEDSDEKYEKHLFGDVKLELQASDAELEASLRDRHILVLNGELRPMTLNYLNTTLELLLNTIVSSSFSLEAVPASEVAETIQYDHDIPQNVSLQVMTWFGDLSSFSSLEKTWKIDIDSVVTQMGIGILSAHRNTPIDQNKFLTKWRMAVGDSFENRVNLSLLSGNFVSSRQSATANAMLVYFPWSELPVAPADRFSDLFLVQTRWRAADINPFLNDITVDSKERDRLLIKFTRSVTDKDGVVWHTSRRGTAAA